MNRVAAQKIANEYMARKGIIPFNHDPFFRIASYNQGMDKTAGLDMKEMFLKYVANPVDKYRRKLHLFTSTLDDLADEIIKGVAPKITEAIREHEVNSDLDEFERGARARYQERMFSRGGYIPEMDIPDDESEEYIEGYMWGNSNNPPPSPEVKKRLVEEAVIEHEGKVTERFVITLMKKFWNSVNPIEILKHAFHMIKKHGWDVEGDQVWYKKWTKRIFKMVVAAIVVSLIESLEHYVIPQLLVELTGNPAWWGLSAVPMLEIGFAIGTAFFRKAEPKEDANETHVDWYEKNFGDLDEIEERNNRQASFFDELDY